MKSTCKVARRIAIPGIASYISFPPHLPTSLCVLLLELNEFNPELMQQAAEKLDTPHLKKLLFLKKTFTTTDNSEERFGLDPWIQWVSIHTGKTYPEHGVHHLADLATLPYPQIWESLGQAGYRCGVWGAMNARLGDAPNTVFFVPDPWSLDQKAHPAPLNQFLALPVYYARHYGHTRPGALVIALCRTLCFLLRPSALQALLPCLPTILWTLMRKGFKDHLLFALFDLVNVALFTRYYRKYQPDFSILFLNSLAHLQHHHWSSPDTLSPEMRDSFRLVDQALGILFDALPVDEPLLVANAFTQTCTADRGEFLYRQRNPELFLHTVGIQFEQVSQLMTNDAHIFFATQEEAVRARQILDGAKLDNESVFHTRQDPKSPDSLFYQLIYWKSADSGALLMINGKSLCFLDFFYCVTKRTGSHDSQGHIFSSGIELPDNIYNHEIHDYLLKAYKK